MARKRTLVIGSKRPQGIGSRPQRVLPVKAGRVTGVRRALRHDDYDRIVVNAGGLKPRRLRRTLRRADRLGGDMPVYAAKVKDGQRAQRKNRIIRQSGAHVIGAGRGAGAGRAAPAGGGGGGGGGGRKGFWGQPIMPGAQVTRRQLKRQVGAAGATRYGPVLGQQRRELGEAQTFQRDIGNYYTDYINQVQRQSQNVAQAGQQANQALQNLQGGVTGLAAADLSQLNQRATADAAARGATAGDLAQMASGAAGTRQALVASFGADQAAQNAAAQNYASNRANVVAPGQRLGGIAQAAGRVRQARQKLTETERERGAYQQQRREEIRSEEGKNILARGALGLNVAKAQADVAATRAKARADRPGTQARTEAQKTLAREGAKYGYGYKAWKALGAGGRARVIRQNKSMPADTVYSSGAFAGRSKSEINKMSPAERQRLVSAYNKNKGGGGGGGGGSKDGGPTPATPARTQGLREEIARAISDARQYKSGLKHHYFAMPRAKAHGTLIAPPNAIGDTAARIALDVAYSGGLSKRNIRMLRNLGYSPRQLGLAKYKRGPTRAQTKRIAGQFANLGRIAGS